MKIARPVNVDVQSVDAWLSSSRGQPGSKQNRKKRRRKPKQATSIFSTHNNTPGLSSEKPVHTLALCL